MGRRRAWLGICLFAWALVEGGATAQTQVRTPRRQQPLPAGVTAHRDLVYRKVGDRALKLDIYAPKTSQGEPLPTIVWIHGGAWRAGSKNHCRPLPYTEKGYVAVSISYRLSQHALFPAQIQDCKAAIRWLRAHAKEYQIDPQRIGVWGSSAGGHLVALLGTAGNQGGWDVGPHLDQSSRVQAVVDFYGPTDFQKMDQDSEPGARIIHDAPDSPESQLIGGPIQKHPNKTQAANPIRYVSKEDPPFLILHGSKDPLVPWQQSQYLMEAFKKAGTKAVAFHLIDGAGHGFGKFKAEVDPKVEQFWETHLKARTPRRSEGIQPKSAS